MNRVFVIDDDRLMREVITRSLAKGEMDVASYPDAVEALDAILTDRPDLVISDVHMPRMTGLELVRRLRSKGARVPVILVSAHASDDEMDEARALGVVRMFKKPLGDLSRLVMAVESELSGHGAYTLDRLDSLRLELLTDLSHELRTPLTATRLAMDGLFSQMDDALDAPQRQLVAISRRNIDRLVALIETYLETLRGRVNGYDDGEDGDDGVAAGTIGLPPGERDPRG